MNFLKKTQLKTKGQFHITVKPCMIWSFQSPEKKKQELKKLNLTFVDVSKAFDSVSHRSIMKAVSRLGAPPLLIEYLSELYKDNWVHVRTGEMSSRIPIGRGVKQGDPMSPTLFNADVDMVLGEVDRSIGIAGDAASKIKCNYIAFADDLLLMSTTDVGMQMLLMQPDGAMAKDW